MRLLCSASLLSEDILCQRDAPGTETREKLVSPQSLLSSVERSCSLSLVSPCPVFPHLKVSVVSSWSGRRWLPRPVMYSGLRGLCAEGALLCPHDLGVLLAIPSQSRWSSSGQARGLNMATARRSQSLRGCWVESLHREMGDPGDSG